MNENDYNELVLLYSTLKGHSMNLLRLFQRKQSKQNEDKLKYELSKSKTSTSISRATSTGLIKSGSVTVEKVYTAELINETSPGPISPKSTNSFYRLNELHPDLHDLSIKQKNDFQLAIAAHSKMTRLHESEEGEALKLCIIIEDLFDAIETAQKVLKHYVDHKAVLKIERREYKDYNAPELIKAQQNKKSSISKYKKKVEAAQAILEKNLSRIDKTKAEINLQKLEEKLMVHEMDMIELNELIKSYE
jgi:hypothetical protein